MSNANTFWAAGATISFTLSVGFAGSDSRPAPLTLEVTVKQPRQTYFVGDSIEFVAEMRNRSDAPVSLLGWTRAGGSFELTMVSETLMGSLASSGGPYRMDDFWTIEPGRSRMVESQPIALMLPGRAQCVARYYSHATNYNRINETGTGWEKVPLPNAWADLLSGRTTLTVSDEMSPAMRRRYADADKSLGDKAAGRDTKIALLSSIAAEKHYFAAGFARNVWKKSDDPAVKLAALRNLLDLLEFGTAFEALPDALELLRAETTPLEIRKRILDIVGKMNLREGVPGFAVGEQAYYILPKDMHKGILGLLADLGRGADPSLSLKAREILRAAEARKTPASAPAKEPPGQTAPPTREKS